MTDQAPRFVQEIRSRHWLGMLAAIDIELIEMARAPLDPRADLDADFRFMKFLIGAREGLLADGRRRPEGLSDEQFALLRPLCEHLVTQGRFARDSLQSFEGLVAPQSQAPESRQPSDEPGSRRT